MKNLLLILMLTIFTANVSAETYNVKTATEQSDRKPNKKKKKKKKTHKKSHKAKKHAKKKGLVGKGCQGLKALPKK
jgi:sorbitol-specific phosphotransferase system component IIBC